MVARTAAQGGRLARRNPSHSFGGPGNVADSCQREIKPALEQRSLDEAAERLGILRHLAREVLANGWRVLGERRTANVPLDFAA